MTTATPKAWSVLVYLVGDHKAPADSLDEAIEAELKAISDAADFKQISVAVQVDFRRKGNTIRATITEPPTASVEGEQPLDSPLTRIITDRLRWQRRHPILTFGESVFQRIGRKLRRMVLKLVKRADINAASEDVLQEFLRFARRKCPARRYLIYFFGHAFGPMGLFFDSESSSRPPNTLRLNDLADAIETRSGRSTIVLFRDCFMSTLETAFQLKSCADFLLASQAEAPIDGVWPWDRFMTTLTADGASLEVATALATHLTNFLKQDGNRGPFADVPYAVLDLSVASKLVAPLKRLVAELEDARTDDRRRAACAHALEQARIGSPDTPDSPGDPALIDVATICKNLRALSPDPVAERATQLAEVLPQLVPFSFTLLGRHKGVALYYKPVTQRDRDRSFIEASDPEDIRLDGVQYKKLALCHESKWGSFALDPLSPT